MTGHRTASVLSWVRDLARRIARPPKASHTLSAPWPDRAHLLDTADDETSRHPIHDLFEQIEADALCVYRRHGLPDQPGDYVRGPGETAWTAIGHPLDVAQKWAMVLDKPSGPGWRYSSLPALGQQAGYPVEIKIASDCLMICLTLRQRLRETVSTQLADDFQSVLDLGAQAQMLRRIVAAPSPEKPLATQPLKLSLPAPKPTRSRRKS